MPQNLATWATATAAVFRRLQLTAATTSAAAAAAAAGRRGLCTESAVRSPLTAGRSGAAAAMRYSFLGGDHNEVTLLGTVTSLKDKELNKDSGVQPYSVLHVATIFRYKDITSGKFRSLIARHQVVAFSANLVKVARQINPGDRVFISGRMQYFFSGSARVATVQATRIVPMLPKQMTAAAAADASERRDEGDEGGEVDDGSSASFD